MSETAQLNPERARPFYCGTQFGDWTTRNCDVCAKGIYAVTGSDYPQWSDVPEDRRCAIEYALGEAYICDGAVIPEIARRMGYCDDVRQRVPWRCPEFEAKR